MRRRDIDDAAGFLPAHCFRNRRIADRVLPATLKGDEHLAVCGHRLEIGGCFMMIHFRWPEVRIVFQLTLRCHPAPTAMFLSFAFICKPPSPGPAAGS